MEEALDLSFDRLLMMMSLSFLINVFHSFITLIYENKVHHGGGVRLMNLAVLTLLRNPLGSGAYVTV